MIFIGRSGPPAPSVSAHIRVSNSLNSHFILFYFFAGPGQFTKRLLIISADAKGKDSMILFKIKETAHINFRPRVVLKFGVARDDGLDARKCTWGGGGSRQCFFLVINLFYSLQSGSNGFITEGRRGSNFFQGVGVSKETRITCDFPGGGGGVRIP